MTYIFIIDTDTYAGNFERYMCAYLTGHVGECGTGEEFANIFCEECPKYINSFDDIIMSLPDENGYYRYCGIYPTPGFWNDGLGNHWPDSDWGKPNVIETYTESCKNYKMIHHEMMKCSAYQSVGIFFYKKPTKKSISLMKKRAQKFSEVFVKQHSHMKPINIIGFRLVKEETSSKEIPI